MKRWDEIQIGEFNGPLDLLLTMIRDKKMSIRDVNLVQLTDQYLSYIESQKALDIEIASEYLTLAAQLIEMKSTFLLPKDDDVFLEEDAYEDFLEQLSRYEQIRSVTDFFMNKQQEYLETFSKPKSKLSFVSKQTTPASEPLIEPLDLDMEEFAQIFKRVMMRSEMNNYDLIDDLEENFNTITTNVISPQEISKMIITKMKTNRLKVWKLEELLSNELMNLKNFISTFLAVLDIVRYQIAKIEQTDHTLLVEFTKLALEDETILDKLEAQRDEN